MIVLGTPYGETDFVGGYFMLDSCFRRNDPPSPKATEGRQKPCHSDGRANRYGTSIYGINLSVSLSK